MTGKTYEEIYGVEKALEMKKQKSQQSLGRKMTIAAIQKLKNVKRTPEWNLKNSLYQKNKKLSLNTRQKISDFMRSDKNPCLEKTRYQFFNDKTNELIWATKHEMRKIYKINMVHKIIRDITKFSMNWKYTGHFIAS